MSCGDDDDVYNVQQPRQQRQPPPPLTTGDSARGGRAADGGQAGFRMRLERLLMELVLREDEGMVVVLPTPSTTRQNDGLFENPAEDRDDNYKTAPPPNRHSNSKGMDEDDFFAKHALDGGGDVLNDILGLFGSSLPCFDDDEMNIDLFHKTQHQHKQQHSSNSSEMMNNNNHSTSLSFQMESLSTLLDRIDHAFSPSTSSNSTNTYRQQQQRRSPPSTHLLNTLTNHSTSINSLIDLLDNWHSLLSGEYYSPNNTTNINSSDNGVMISIDGESAHGVYLRRVCLGMEELGFEAVSRLWMSLRNYLEKEVSNNYGGDCNTGEEKKIENGDYFFEGSSSDGGECWLPSNPQIERIVRRTCLAPNLDSLLRGQGTTSNSSLRSNTNSSAALSVQQQQHQPPPQTHNLLHTHPECPSLHFFLFLSSLANGDRSHALESLHRYFDYAMIHERKERAERAMMLQASGSTSSTNGGNNAAGNNEWGVTGMGGIITTMTSGMGGITGGMTGGQGRGGTSHSSGGNNNKYKESNVMQYAAILLAQMYHRFGYLELSIQATEEAIRVAQQSGDEECVLFAQSWLALSSSDGGGDGNASNRAGSVYATVGGLANGVGTSTNNRPLATSTFGNSSGGSFREEEMLMLQRCHSRAADRGLSSLAAGASLELARRAAYQRRGEEGDSSLGANDEQAEDVSSLAWESIQQLGRTSTSSATTNTGRRGMMGGQGAAATISGGVANTTDVDNMTASDALGVLGRQNMAISGLWDSTGHSSLASLSSCAALYGFGTKLCEGDKSVAMRRVLSSFSYGPGFDAWSKHERGLSSCVYAKSLQQLSTLCGVGTHDLSPEWIQSATSTLHEWSVRSYDLSMAQGLQCILANQSAFPSDTLLAVETSLVSLTHSTHLHLQRGDYERAKVTTRRACWLASKQSLLFHQGWHLLQLALIDLEAYVTAPSTNPPVERALAPLLECLNLSEQYAMDPLRAVALTTLAKVMLGMGHFWKARAMLNAAMPLVMQHGHIWFQAEACLIIAKCYLTEAASSENDQKEELRRTALFQLENSTTLFGQIEDIQRLRQVYYLQAIICQSLPNMQQKRNKVAKLYIQMSAQRLHRMSSASMTTPKANSNSMMCNVMQGIMVTDAQSLQRCISMKQLR